MPAIVSMLRGVNVGGHNKIRMEALRTLCDSLDLRKAQTYVQSGNVVFLTKERNLVVLSSKIEDAIEKTFGFRAGVVLRTAPEMNDVISRNPFAKRSGIDPRKLLIIFLPTRPAAETKDGLLRLKPDPEELHIAGRELYVYFPNGMGRSKLTPVLDRVLKKSGTGRNFNTVTRLLEMAEGLEKSR